MVWNVSVCIEWLTSGINFWQKMWTQGCGKNRSEAHQLLFLFDTAREFSQYFPRIVHLPTPPPMINSFTVEENPRNFISVPVCCSLLWIMIRKTTDSLQPYFYWCNPSGKSLEHASELRPNPKKNMMYGTLCRSWPPLMFTPESTTTHLPWALGNPMPESTLTLCRSRLYPPGQGLWFGLWLRNLLCS